MVPSGRKFSRRVAKERPAKTTKRPPLPRQNQEGRSPRETRNRLQRAELRVPVVGIGFSPGGLEAVSELLQALPPEPGAVFVLVQHLDPPARESLAAPPFPVVRLDQPGASAK
ncbi:MAG: hypothetical protein HY716_03500 [Planctomycetes bacterium]|nr:hypothetical protein [Planctomycetota bacterium]